MLRKFLNWLDPTPTSGVFSSLTPVAAPTTNTKQSDGDALIRGLQLTTAANAWSAGKLECFKQLEEACAEAGCVAEFKRLHKAYIAASMALVARLASREMADLIALEYKFHERAKVYLDAAAELSNAGRRYDDEVGDALLKFAVFEAGSLQEIFVLLGLEEAA